MKCLLVLSTLVAVAYGGVGNLSPQEEAEALQLFQRLCSGGGGGYSGGGGYGGGGGGGGGGEGGQQIGDMLVYCKRANGDRQETLQHTVSVSDNSRQPAQVVFVQPPPVRYQHNVLVQGGASQGQQTKVYVLPQQASHEIKADYRGQQAAAVKPTVYFLRGNSGSSGSGPGNSYGPPSGPPPQQPNSQYGAPNGYSG